MPFIVDCGPDANLKIVTHTAIEALKIISLRQSSGVQIHSIATLDGTRLNVAQLAAVALRDLRRTPGENGRASG